MKKKLEVGLLLYSLNVGNAARRGVQKLSPVRVTRVGRKYFTCCPDGGSQWQETQYHIDGWYEKTEYSANSILYFDRQQWKDEKEALSICSLIRKAFEFGNNRKNIPLDQLKIINQIITDSDNKRS